MSSFHILKSAAFAVLCAVLLSACAAQTVAPVSEVSFPAAPRLTLEVANVSVVNNDHTASAASEAGRTVTPASLAERWALERLHAAGTSGTATLTIQRASVVEEALPGKSGVEGLVGDYPVAKYVARLAARLTVVKPGNLPGALSTYSADVNVWAESSTMKRDTLAERDRAYNELMQKIATQFDQSLTREIQRGMGPVVRGY